MEKKWWALIMLAVAALIIVIALLFVKQTYLAPVSLDECKVLKYSGEGKPSVVIFSDNQIAQEYMNFFFSIKPYDKNKDKFNFYYIDSYEPNCDIYQGVALLCYSRELIKKAASCPNDYIVVIGKGNEGLRSSSYMNVISIVYGTRMTVFSHEFGHAFANFADEYTPASIPKNSKNCVPDCGSFGEGKEGCFEGCSRDDYFRSIDAGIMSTLDSMTYGKFDENIIISKIRESAGITGSAVLANRDCSKETYILLDGNYSDGKMSILGRSVERGCVGGNGAGGFGYSVTKEDGSIIKGGEFNPELIFTDSLNGSKMAGGTTAREGAFLLKVPVIENSKSLEISSEGQTIAEVNLKDVGARPCRV